MSPNDPNPLNEADRALDRRLDALVRHVPSPDALWPGIDERIRHRRSRTPALAAAATIAVIAVAAALLVPRAPEPGVTAMRALIEREAQALRAGAPASLLPAMWQPPVTIAPAWRDNQAAIAELEAALERDPDNPLLLEFLAAARLRQAELANAVLFPPNQRSL